MGFARSKPTLWGPLFKNGGKVPLKVLRKFSLSLMVSFFFCYGVFLLFNVVITHHTQAPLCSKACTPSSLAASYPPLQMQDSHALTGEVWAVKPGTPLPTVGHCPNTQRQMITTVSPPLHQDDHACIRADKRLAPQSCQLDAKGAESPSGSWAAVQGGRWHGTQGCQEVRQPEAQNPSPESRQAAGGGTRPRFPCP